MRAPFMVRAAAVAVPWAWYVVRDRWTGFDGVAVALPVLTSLGAAVVVLTTVVVPSTPAVLLPVGISMLLVGVTATLAPWSPRVGPAPLDPVRVAAAVDEVRAATAARSRRPHLRDEGVVRC